MTDRRRTTGRRVAQDPPPAARWVRRRRRGLRQHVCPVVHRQEHRTTAPSLPMRSDRRAHVDPWTPQQSTHDSVSRAPFFKSTGQAPSICGERPRDAMRRQPARPVLRVTSSGVVSEVGCREAATVRWRDHRRVKEPGRVELGCRSFAEGDHEESDDEDHGAACCDRGGKSQGETLTP